MRPADLAFEQLCRANPVPDPAALRQELAETVETDEETEITMSSTITTDSPKRTRNRRPRRWGLLAAVVVLMLGGATTIFLATDSAPTPVEIAEAYIDARNAYDVEGARELVSEDFITTEFPDGWLDVEGMEAAFRGFQAYGFEYRDVSCTEVEETDIEVTVRCEFLWDTHVHRIGNHLPNETSLTVFITDGEINRTVRGASDQAFWNDFTRFLRAEHPDFLAVVDGAIDLDPSAVESLEADLPRHLALYQEWVDSRDG